MRKKKELRLKDEVADQLIAIGDVHGLTTWRQVIEAHPDAGRYVFLGDYCDPYGTKISDEMVVHNLIEIIEFKKRYPDRVVLLLGNHDMHYCVNGLSKGSRYNVSLSMILHDLFERNKALFQPAYACNHLLFTHAGIVHSWFDEFGGNLNDSVAEQLNDRRDDPMLLHCGFLRGGDQNFGGIFWADMDEFATDELLPGYIQIVGHNRVDTIQVVGESMLSTGMIVFCDSLYQDNYLVVAHPSAEEPEFYESNLKKKD